MSLQVWLPLTKDLRQQGLSNVTVTNNGATFNSAGKLGGCYTSTASGQTITINFSNLSTMLANGKTYSLSCWVKPTGTPSSGWVVKLGDNSCGLWWAKSEARWVWNENDNGKRCANPTISADYTNWHHLVIVVDKTVSGKITTKQYVDGDLAAGYPGSTWDSSSHSQPTGTTITISPYVAQLNDVRLYDHCLSPMEIKELSKGLVLHYPLNRQGWGQENLLKYTKVNVTNQNLLKTVSSGWGNLTLTTKDGYDCYLYPSAQNSTWFYSGNWYSGMKANTTYTYTAWIYFTANASFTFTSLGHFQVYNSASTASDKAHEDVVSARIYEPSTIVANTWTKVRITFTTNDLANSYFVIYPRYNIGANVGDLYFRDCKLEESSVPTPWCPHSIDNEYSIMGLNGIIEYDCSGFCNNGTRTGTFSWTSDAPKYLVSTGITAGGGIFTPMNITFSQYTIAFWAKHTVGSKMLMGSCPSAGSTQTSWYWYGDNSFKYPSGEYYYTYNGGTKDSFKWTHFVATYDGTNVRVYRNGVSEGSKACTGDQAMAYLSVGYGYGSSYTENSNMSDFRIYATALSADDVLSLYQNSAYIDSSGNVYGAVHSEV